MTVETLYYALKEEMRTGGKFKDVTVTVPGIDKTVDAVNLAILDDSFTIFIEPIKLCKPDTVQAPNGNKE